jgi:hypothetical protein
MKAAKRSEYADDKKVGEWQTYDTAGELVKAKQNKPKVKK